jgi:uncharacterized alpha-E superfamily protein
MLARVADSLYWMSRYLERAEHTARLLDVNLHGQLDQQRDLSGRQWERVLKSLTVPVTEAALRDPAGMVERLIFDPTARHSVVGCIGLARQNAREVREQISTEMWEQLNRLYLHIQRLSRYEASEGQRYEFFQLIKQGSHLFRGIAGATLSREEGWHFIELGRYLERVTGTVNLLDAHVVDYREAADGPAAADQYQEWVGLLKSCTALEAYWRVHTANIQPEKAAAFLLLDAEFPQSVRFGVEAVQSSLDSLAESVPNLKRSDVHRRVGKVLSALSFDSIEEIVARDMHAFLTNIRVGCSDVHHAVYLGCITYPIDQALIV